MVMLQSAKSVLEISCATAVYVPTEFESPTTVPKMGLATVVPVSMVSVATRISAHPTDYEAPTLGLGSLVSS